MHTRLRARKAILEAPDGYCIKIDTPFRFQTRSQCILERFTLRNRTEYGIRAESDYGLVSNSRLPCFILHLLLFPFHPVFTYKVSITMIPRLWVRARFSLSHHLLATRCIAYKLCFILCSFFFQLHLHILYVYTRSPQQIRWDQWSAEKIYLFIHVVINVWGKKKKKSLSGEIIESWEWRIDFV